MNRRIFSLVLSLLVLSVSGLSVHGLPYRIHDEAGLMSDAQITELEELADSVSASTGLDLVILTTENLGGRSPAVYADDYYDSNGYGEDGMLFMLAMQERDWYISTAGKAIDSFDDRDIDALLDAGLAYFSVGYHYEGFCEVLRQTENLWGSHTARNGSASIHLDRASSSGWGQTFLISMLIGGVISGIVILIMRGAMNTKRAQRSAADYLIPGSYHLRTRQDIFLYSNVTKTPRQQSTSGSTSHTSSSGRSHGGGGRKF